MPNPHPSLSRGRETHLTKEKVKPNHSKLEKQCPKCHAPLVADELEQFGCGMCGYEIGDEIEVGGVKLKVSRSPHLNPTPSVIKSFRKKFTIGKYLDVTKLEAFILKAVTEAYVDGYQKGSGGIVADVIALKKQYQAGRQSILDEYKAEQAKLLKGFKHD